MELFEYQLKYLEGLPKNVFMGADVGTGKTKMSIEHARRHSNFRNSKGENEILDLLVVAPASKVKTGDWQEEIHECGFIRNYFVVSYEGFTKHWMSLVAPTTTIVFDEVHYLANATSKRGKAAVKAMTVCHQWIGLSATLLPNGWRSAATYAIATGLVRNKTAFFNRFVITDRSRGFPIIMGYREEATLEQWWATVAKPLKRTGDLRLPSRMIALEPKMTQYEVSEYKRLKEQRITRDGELLDSPSKLFTALRQESALVRVVALERLLDGTDEHVIVFYNFNKERDMLRAMLENSYPERTIYEQSGHMSDLPPREEWATMPPSVTLAQYQSASQAIELTYASITVYLSPPTSYANYEQSKGRTRRHGQERTTLFYHIAVQGTLDRYIWQLVGRKQQFSTEIVNKLIDYQ